ncbi:MAG: hypothetical protein K2X91_08775, partial [Thermoleophilia bacterium]|nr:hypothetical protein [Thermoleophilia bacterium]
RVLQVDADANGVGTGRAVIGPTSGPGVGPVDDAFINLPDRIFPSPWSVTAGGTPPEPQFVVDLAVRRMTPIIQGGPDNQVDPGGALLYERPGNFTVQMALFARRIDARIRPMVGVSIMQSIADTGAPINKRRWPVSEDDTGNPLGDGTMTGAGSPRYSLPYTVNVAFDPNVPDRLVVQSADDSMVNAGTQRSAQTAFRQMSADGQIVVDNLGTVYNILGADDRVTGMALRISPSVKGNVPASGGADPRRLHQVVVCPQAPASVNVITVNP